MFDWIKVARRQVSRQRSRACRRIAHGSRRDALPLPPSRWVRSYALVGLRTARFAVVGFAIANGSFARGRGACPLHRTAAGGRRGDAAVTLAVVTPAVSNIKLRLAFLREYPTPAQLCNHRCTIASHGIRGRDKRLARA